MTVTIGGCAVLLFGVEGLLDLRDEERDLKEDVAQQTRLLGRSLQKAFKNALRDRQIEDVSEMLTALAAVEPTVAILVYDEDGEVVATSKGAQRTRSTDGLAARGRVSQTPILEFDPEDTPSRLRLAIRLREEKEARSSAIVLERPLHELNRDLAATRRYVALSTTLFVLTVAALTWLLTQRYVGRPLGGLVGDMHKLSGTPYVPSSDRPDEVAETRAEFDRLVVALGNARARTAEEIEARRGLERGLERADKLIALGQLSAVMAHEIGSPLQILQGRALSLQKSATDPETRRVAGMLAEQTERITRIVSQMLSITRRRAPVRTTLEVEALVNRVLSLLELEAARRGVQLVLTASGAGRLSADADQLQQVVLNLVRNALEVAPRETKVTVSLEGDARAVVLAVHDEGPGVPDEARSRLFEPFFTTKPDGSGLGLSVVRSLVREHQGDVRLVDVSKGFTVEVSLPRAPEGAVDERA